MILAAGYGTRMRPVTYTLPKPLVPACNLPLLGWAVESLLRSGIRELIVNLHHLPEQIETWLLATYAQQCEIHFSFESEILGTGGGIRRVRPLLENEEDFVVVNGDTIQFSDDRALCEARRRRDALAALVLRHPPAGDRFTPVFSDAGRITGFGQGSGEALMFSGAHCISSRVFRYLPARDFSGMVQDVYQPMLGREVLTSITDDNRLWFDTGTPKRLMQANATLLDAIVRGELQVPRDSRIEGDSVMAESARGQVVRSSVGARSVIEGDVRDSAVWDDCHIAAGVELDRCIVAHGVELKRGRFRDVLICQAGGVEGEYLKQDGLAFAAI